MEVSARHSSTAPGPATGEAISGLASMPFFFSNQTVMTVGAV